MTSKSLVINLKAFRTPALVEVVTSWTSSHSPTCLSPHIIYLRSSCWNQGNISINLFTSRTDSRAIHSRTNLGNLKQKCNYSRENKNDSSRCKIMFSFTRLLICLLIYLLANELESRREWEKLRKHLLNQGCFRVESYRWLLWTIFCFL